MPIMRPIWYAIWSPSHAPAAAVSSTSHIHGVPVECAETVSVMTTDSLGSGGKKPSIVAKANMAG